MAAIKLHFTMFSYNYLSIGRDCKLSVAVMFHISNGPHYETTKYLHSVVTPQAASYLLATLFCSLLN